MTAETAASGDAPEIAEKGKGQADRDSAAPEKAPPYQFAMRARLAPVVRFRRMPTIALAGTSVILLVIIGWFALRSPETNPGVPEESRTPATQAAPDALVGAPTSYAEVPPLGEPLPGDLGRAILARQRQESEARIDPAPEIDAQAAVRAAQHAEAERQRMESEQRAARESDVMLDLSSPVTRRKERSRPPIDGVAPGMTAALDDARGAKPQRRPNELADAGNGDTSVNPHRLETAVSPWTLQAGSVIAASLITGLNSDLPGIVTAQVTGNVYDSVTGRILLVPQGARLIGRYDNVVAFGQSRALVIWQRIIFPDGASIRIDDAPASDTEGYAGLADRIDRHSWRLLKGVALSTLLGVGTELGWRGRESDLARAIREAAQQAGSRAGDQLVARNLDVQPSLRVRPGWPLRVLVHKDIILRPWRAGGPR
ncbi:TrbI/VirB10 family protein [Sphingopyxis sp. MWB1]|uniref:TrbI/VirB10 family protein n=1 Tax=Sphingopyxis sp. MWB1 TaxID=1537715 RepID=UPI0009DDBCB5|nr:TrbI/VirB10 family protein [Sphingopyxis sp. MWB1]